MSDKPCTSYLANDLHSALDAIIRRGALPRVLRHLNDLSGSSFDRSTYWLTVRLSETGGVRLSQLADMQGTDLSTISRQVAACEQDGLIERRPDPSDARATLVSLTPQGDAMVQRRLAVQRAELLHAVSDWSEEDQHTFARLLTRFASRFHEWAVSDALVESTNRA